MAIQTKKKYSGAKNISTINGNVRLNSNGITTYDTDGNIMLISGKDPQGASAGITAVAIQGEDAVDNL